MTSLFEPGRAEVRRGACRVLVVDDHQDFAELLARLLRGSGQVCQTATGGRAAIEAFGLFDPDVVLLDLCLPDVSGYEVARIMKMHSPDIGIVAMTGNVGPTSVACAFAAGADDFALKPLDTEHLDALVLRCARAKL